MVSVIYAVTLITIMPFIRVYTDGITDVQYTNFLIAFLFVANGLLYNLKTPQGMLVIAAGLYKETRVQSTIQAAILVVGGALLGYKYGLVGVMLASCLSNLYRCIDLYFFIPKTVTHMKRKSTLRNIIITILMITLTYFTAPKVITMVPTSLFSWVIYAALVMIYCIIFISVFHIIFQRKSFKIIINRIKSLGGK